MREMMMGVNCQVSHGNLLLEFMQNAVGINGEADHLGKMERSLDGQQELAMSSSCCHPCVGNCICPGDTRKRNASSLTWKCSVCVAVELDLVFGTNRAE